MGWHPASGNETVTSRRHDAAERRPSNEIRLRHQRRRNAQVNFHLDPRTKAALEIAHMLQLIGDLVQRRASTQSLEN
ncbi:hypothetical protein AC249_AIPGENE13024 [Exaiptasia diaphana]|nr:hypothetical protein AC249_AIPGENE13024 [Exaiptasia diaphana]